MNRDYRDKHNQQNTRDRRKISDAEDTIEKINALIKENSKFNKFSSQNIQEIWDTIKKTKSKNNRE